MSDTAEAVIHARISEHTKLARQACAELARRLPDNDDRDDLIQAAYEGLVDAARRYTPDGRASFASYAWQRIQGAIIDERRRDTWLPRSVLRDMRALKAAEQRLAQTLMRTPRTPELAAALGWSVDSLARLRAEYADNSVHVYDDNPEYDARHTTARTAAAYSGGQPSAAVETQALAAQVHDAIADLAPRQRHVLRASLEHDRPLAEIGAELGITESGACQLRGRAVRQVRVALGIDGDAGAMAGPRAGGRRPADQQPPDRAMAQAIVDRARDMRDQHRQTA